MTTAFDTHSIFANISPPIPVLTRDREEALTPRQRELLADLELLFFAEGFADHTMASLAQRMRCSLRTLYAVASSRDELVLIAVDRNLWRVGRTARTAIRANSTAFEAAQDYLRAALWAVSDWTPPFARDLSRITAASALERGHNEYLYAVTRELLTAAVDSGDVHPFDTIVVARVLAGLGQQLTRPNVLPTLKTSPRESAGHVVDIVFRGLATNKGDTS